MKFIGDSANMKIIRDGKEMAVSTQLSYIPRLVPVHCKKSSYFIVGGLLFTGVCVCVCVCARVDREMER